VTWRALCARPYTKDKGAAVTFKAREKRKREIGQQASGKNWVEEEKRQLRESSGFGFD